MRLDGKAIKAGSIPLDRLETEMQARFAVVSWGTPEVVDGSHVTVELQLKDLAGEDLAASKILRVTCDSRATLSVGAHGTALSTAPAEDVIFQTDADGLLDLVVECDVNTTITLAAGPTQGSPMMDCSATVNVVFA